MPPEIARHVFEPFFTTKPQGTGLGLAMAYAFVQRHGGRIHVETSPGRGTRVRMWFAAGPAQRRDASAPARRLLVVEDEPVARTALQALLAEDGFAVEVAGSGDEALAKLATFDPEVLVVDLRMPGMDGATLIRRAREGRSALPVVMMSGADELPDAAARLLREPVTAHVAKPIDAGRLVAAVERMLGPPAASSGP
jgi:CheY-like chemotaxis protein